MKVFVTWQPGDRDDEQTLTWDGATEAEYQSLLNAWASAGPDDVLQIPTRVIPDGPQRERLFRVSRIRSIRAGASREGV